MIVDTTGHVDHERLAELVDGTLPPWQASMVRFHLTECRSCMAAYADAVRYRAAWLADRPALASDDEALRWARSGPKFRSAADRTWVQSVKRVLPIAAAAAFVMWLAASQLAGGAPSLSFELRPAVRDAAERSSARGLVLPGVADGADRSRPELRSGQAATSPRLEREVRDAIERYERNGTNADAGAGVVAALLATGEIDAAREYARECLRRFPGHVPLLVFASDASYRSSDLPRAEELLREAARRAPHDPVVTLDLALVLRQTGRDREARELLMRVTKSRLPSLAARASRELERLQQP